MGYTEQVRAQLKTVLSGYAPDDIAEVFYAELVTLLANDPQYFANGRGNSLTKTLEWASNLVKEASNA